MSANLPNPDSINWDEPALARQHVLSMPAEYRARIEREFQAGAGTASRIVSEPISDEIKARAAREWGEL